MERTSLSGLSVSENDDKCAIHVAAQHIAVQAFAWTKPEHKGNEREMAIAFIRTQPVSRKTGRSAVGAASYRAGERLVDERLGQVFDYTRRSGVEHVELLMPEHAGLAAEWSREALWNAAEAAEKRKDSRVAREWVGALPVELSQEQRIEVSREFAKELAGTYGVAVDFALHEPGKHGDERNYHVHYLATTRSVVNGELGEKAALEKGLDTIHVVQLRAVWETKINGALERAGKEERIDMRPLPEQRDAAVMASDVIRAAELDRQPSIHLGWQAAAMERRGLESERGSQIRQIEEQNEARRPEALERARMDVLAARSRVEATREDQVEQQWKTQTERLKPAIQEAVAGRAGGEISHKIREASPHQGTITLEQRIAQVARLAELAARPKIEVETQAREIYCAPQQAELTQVKAELSSAAKELADYERAHPFRVKLADQGFLGIKLLRVEDRQLNELRSNLHRADSRHDEAMQQLKRTDNEYGYSSGGRKTMAFDQASNEAKLQQVAHTILESIEKNPHRMATLEEMDRNMQRIIQEQITHAAYHWPSQDVVESPAEEAEKVQQKEEQSHGSGEAMSEVERLKASLSSEDVERIERYASSEIAQGTEPDQVRDAIEKWMLPESPAAREYAQDVVERQEKTVERNASERDLGAER